MDGYFIPIDPIEVVAARVQHHKDIDIPAWQSGNGDWFTIHLFSLMAQSDRENFGRLALVFPEQAEAFQWWKTGGETT